MGAGGRSLLPRLRLTGFPPTLREGLVWACSGLGLETCGTPGYPPSKQVPTDAYGSWAPASFRHPLGPPQDFMAKIRSLPPAFVRSGRLSKKNTVFSVSN